MSGIRATTNHPARLTSQTMPTTHQRRAQSSVA